jgi:hypothetical protein
MAGEQKNHKKVQKHEKKCHFSAPEHRIFCQGGFVLKEGNIWAERQLRPATNG